MAIKTNIKNRNPVVHEEPVEITFLKIAGTFLLALVLIVVFAVLLIVPTSVTTTYNTPYEDCAAAGNPILKTYPAKCVWPNGQTVTQIIPGVNDIDSFEDCAAAGYPIMESYPEQCRTPDGKTFAKLYPSTN